MKKRILSLVLALSMMISLFPVSALAQTPGGGSLCLHLEDSFGTQEELRGKLLIFSIYDARRKVQGASDAAAENIGTEPQWTEPL